MYKLILISLLIGIVSATSPPSSIYRQKRDAPYPAAGPDTHYGAPVFQPFDSYGPPKEMTFRPFKEEMPEMVEPMPTVTLPPAPPPEPELPLPPPPPPPAPPILKLPELPKFIKKPKPTPKPLVLKEIFIEKKPLELSVEVKEPIITKPYPPAIEFTENVPLPLPVPVLPSVPLPLPPPPPPPPAPLPLPLPVPVRAVPAIAAPQFLPIPTPALPPPEPLHLTLPLPLPELPVVLKEEYLNTKPYPAEIVEHQKPSGLNIGLFVGRPVPKLPSVVVEEKHIENRPSVVNHVALEQPKPKGLIGLFVSPAAPSIVKNTVPKSGIFVGPGPRPAVVTPTVSYKEIIHRPASVIQSIYSTPRIVQQPIVPATFAATFPFYPVPSVSTQVLHNYTPNVTPEITYGLPEPAWPAPAQQYGPPAPIPVPTQEYGPPLLAPIPVPSQEYGPPPPAPIQVPAQAYGPPPVPMPALEYGPPINQFRGWA